MNDHAETATAVITTIRTGIRNTGVSAFGAATTAINADAKRIISRKPCRSYKTQQDPKEEALE